MLKTTQLIQKLLFEHPLYSTCRPGDPVLIRGDDGAACSFADQCLQASQGMDLQLFWQITSPETRKRYLTARPALGRFIQVDGASCAGPYGALTFLLPEDWDRAGNPSYAFLSGEGSVSAPLTARFLQDSVDVNAQPVNGLSPERLEDMAFTTHMVWAGAGNIDYEQTAESFRREENRCSSGAFALSIPYKLHAIGIEAENSRDAARALQQRITRDSPQDRQALEQLAILEHRRWILEKVCQGARPLRDSRGEPDLEICVTTRSIKQRDPEGLRHPCVERCWAGSSLADYSRRSWDRPNRNDYSLDDLDTMSLKLHRIMLREALALREDPRELNQALWDLGDIYRRAELGRIFSRFRFCLENILDRNLPYAAQFESYAESLVNAIGDLAPEDRTSAGFLLRRIRELIFPALNLYRDYKQYDRDLIRRLPYILTARYPVHLCMALGSTVRRDNEDRFQSVASATALFARKITYLYVPEPAEQAAHLLSRLKAIRSYFLYRSTDCRITLQVMVDSTWNRKRKNLRDALDQALDLSYIQDYTLREYHSREEMLTLALGAISESGADFYDGTTLLLSSPYENSLLLQQIPLPYLEFDSYNRKFRNLRDCEDLAYVPVTTFLQVEDMFSLMNAEDKKFTYQDYGDCYLNYWKIYSGEAIGEPVFYLCAQCWTKVCTLLRSGGREILSYENVPLGSRDPSEIRIMKKMLRALEENGDLRNLRFFCRDPQNDVPRDFRVSLEITGDRSKAILSKAGDILEIYVYFEACRTGWFDDVQTGYQFLWEDRQVSNEMDCVLTKGYRSVLVECKSTKDSQEGFYLTLDSLAERFGIGCKKVIVMVTNTDLPQYAAQDARGRQMDIITLSTRQDLDRIGVRLKEIMED